MYVCTYVAHRSRRIVATGWIVVSSSLRDPHVSRAIVHAYVFVDQTPVPRIKGDRGAEMRPSVLLPNEALFYRGAISQFVNICPESHCSRSFVSSGKTSYDDNSRRNVRVICTLLCFFSSDYFHSYVIIASDTQWFSRYRMH